jgi:hypothetical protein
MKQKAPDDPFNEQETVRSRLLHGTRIDEPHSGREHELDLASF